MQTRLALDSYFSGVPALVAAWPVLGGIAGRLLIGLLGFVVGLAAFAVLAVVEFGAWALVAPPRPRSLNGEPADLPVDPVPPSEPISVLAPDGSRLAGRWHPAPGLGSDKPGRTVLLLHGFAENSNGLQARRVAALNQAGWNAAVLDLRGYGDSAGPLATFGGREAGDLRAWLDGLAERFAPAHSLRPALWGRSMGAAIAIRAAAEDPRIKALVLESPMVDLDQAMTVVFRSRRFPFPRLLARLVTRRAGKLAGMPLHRPSPLDLAPRVSCPTLILHGSNDALVTPAEAGLLASAFPSPALYLEVPGAGHADVVAAGGPELLAKVTAFLDEAAADRRL